MNQNPYEQPNPFATSSSWTVAQSPAEVRMAFIQKTYILFFASLLAAIVVGGLTLNVFPMLAASAMVWKMPLLAIGLLIGGSLLAGALSRVEGLNYVALFGFTSLIGFLFAPVLSMYERTSPGIVGQAAFITVLIFGSLTAYAFTTKKDFSFMGGLLFVGLISLCIASLANVFFFKSGGASYWMAWISAFLFSGFVLYDTSQIIHRYDEKGYCAAALALFLDFFNLFMAILRILGGNRD
jgi:modulator of FtsH protease